MKYGKRIQPISFTTNVVDANYTAFDNTALVPKGEFRLADNKSIYEAYTNIYPLATYGWNHINEGTNGICTILADKSIVADSTLVPCVQNTTVVYIQDSWKDTTGLVDGKYFKYTATDANVDFNSIDVTNPSDWEEIINYRHDDVIPSESSIYWNFIDVINSERHLDGRVFNQTVLDIGNIITNEYIFEEADFIDTIAFFNMDLTSIEITVTTQDDTILIPTFSIDMLDYQGINTSYDWHFTSVEGGLKKNAFAHLSPYADIKIKIDYINTNGEPKIGETFFSKATDMGETINRPQGRKKKFDKITIDSSTGKKTRIKSNAMVDEVTYTVSVDTISIDSKITVWSDLINEDILIIGDESGRFTNLIHFCYIQEFPYEIDSGSTKNKYQIKLTTLA